MESLKKFSPAFYVVIILLFFLPFVNLSCSGQTIMSLTGFQLITGAEYSQQNIFDQNMPGQQDITDIKQSDKIDSQPFALYALLAAIVGLLISFFRNKPFALINTIIAILGAVFLIILKINIDGDAKISGQEMIKIEYQSGYWLTFILFIITAIVFWLIFREKAPVAASVNETQPPASPQQ